ncbi:DUF222 domain-containing protein [Leucobacter insecticola]|uniref:DUF222 domain-containing protein n=1 Tax=Leucobacter insecticola TaxID=2714934 RepID=A0A6G8FL39_9MICO|nr:HNH endonuclease signature motif containing protein [Leucobacter insecticola]QIM16792.1 DUF222 domain-containing protein [Leucobacter insecticola]
MESPTITLTPLAPGERAGSADFGDSGGVGVGRSAGLEAVFAAVADQLDSALAPGEVPGLSDAEVVSGLIAVESLQRKLAALQLTLAAAADTRSRDRVPDLALASVYGCKNAVELLQRTTLVSASTARQRIRVGQTVVPRNGYSLGMLPPQHPHLAAALEDGALGIESAVSIAGMLDRAGKRPGSSPEALDIAERELVTAATEPVLPLHADQTRVQCGVWEQFLDPDGTLPDEEAAFMRRGFRFGKERGGLVPVSGALVPEAAALLARLFDSVNSPRTDTNSDATNGETGSGSSGHSGHSGSSVRFVPVPESIDTDTDTDTDTDSDSDAAPTDTARTPDQKRHDALAILLGTAARHPETPLLGGAPVTVLVQVTDTDLTATDSSAASARLHDHNGLLVPVSMSAARHAACAGATQRITQDARGRILGLESPSRVFTPHQRRAITLRDGGCVIPGCNTPASWCEIHHVTEHAQGGPTHTDNGVLLCWYHHRSLDTSGWQVRMSDGVPEIRAPRWLDPEQRWRPHHPPGKLKLAA